MIKLRLCDYSDISGSIEIPNRGTTADPNNRKIVIIKNCATFTDFICEMNNTQINNAKDIDRVMPM